MWLFVAPPFVALFLTVRGLFYFTMTLNYRNPLDYAKARYSKFINHLGKFNICRCFLKPAPDDAPVAVS